MATYFDAHQGVTLEMAVQQVLAGLENAWNAGDGAAWGRQFTKDAEFVDVLGRIQVGSEVIGAEHQKLFDTIYAGSTLTYRLLRSRELGAGLVLVHTGTVLRVPAGPRAGEWHSVQTKVLRDGRVTAFQNTALTDMADFSEHDGNLAARAPQQWQHEPGNQT